MYSLELRIYFYRIFQVICSIDSQTYIITILKEIRALNPLTFIFIWMFVNMKCHMFMSRRLYFCFSCDLFKSC